MHLDNGQRDLMVETCGRTGIIMPVETNKYFLVIGESAWKFVEPLPQPRLGKHNSVLVGLSVMDIFRTEVTL